MAPSARFEELIGPDRTDCFGLSRLRLSSPFTEESQGSRIAIVTKGSVAVGAAGKAARFDTFDRFLLPAGLERLDWTPIDGDAEVLFCTPPPPPL